MINLDKQSLMETDEEQLKPSDRAIIEKNKLIARFMGYEYFGHGDERLKGTPPGWKSHAQVRIPIKRSALDAKLGDKYLCRNHNQLAYDRSWDWLMLPVQRLARYEFRIVMETEVTTIYDTGDTEEVIAQVSGDSMKSNTFECMALFIRWLNKEKASL